MDTKCTFKQSRLGTAAFATVDIAAGETIKLFTGEIRNTKDTLRMVGRGYPRRDDPFQIDDDLYILMDDSSLYFNHSCQPSAAVRGYNDLFAYRSIGIGEEITFDYSTVVGMSAFNSVWTMKCDCGSPKCRKTIGSVLSIPAAELKEYAYNGGLPDFIIRQCVKIGLPFSSLNTEMISPTLRSLPR